VRKDRLEILRHGCGTRQRVALKPVLKRRQPGRLGGNTNLAHFEWWPGSSRI
jgi:hypothetical protein